MRLGGRIQAAADVLDDVLNRRTPATLALRDWGKSNRFAGSKDRSAIGNLVHDALRKKSSFAWRMDSEDGRSLALASAVFGLGHRPGKLASDFESDKYAPSNLSQNEVEKLSGKISLDGAPDWVKADVPEWIWPAFSNNFADESVAEGMALSERPPLDVRVNSLKSDGRTVLSALSGMDLIPTSISPIGLRIPPIQGNGRHPNIQSEPSFQLGHVEIQDEGSQIISLLANARPGDTVLDYCAGGGGKTLALAAEMKNEGQIYAFDIDKRRLAPLFQRAMRAGANIIDVRQPPKTSLSDLEGKMNKVFIDAPCTGTGTWRRKPDTKWRLSEESLQRRNNEQQIVLREGSRYVRDGGLMFYATCSVLAEENEAQVYKFLDDHPEFALLSAGEVWEEKFGNQTPKPWSSDGCTITLTPASTQTDGFFFAVLERQKG